MSADKPIQRFSLLANLEPEGAWVWYDDHLAAVRSARAEAFEEAMKSTCRFCAEGKEPKLDRDTQTHYVHLFQGYAPKDCKASGIHAMLAKERTQ